MELFGIIWNYTFQIISMPKPCFHIGIKRDIVPEPGFGSSGPYVVGSL